MPSSRTFSKPLLPFSCRGAVLATLALVSGAFMVQEAAATSARRDARREPELPL